MASCQAVLPSTDAYSICSSAILDMQAKETAGQAYDYTQVCFVMLCQSA